MKPVKIIRKPAKVTKVSRANIADAAQPAHKVRYKMNAAHASSVKERALRVYRKAQKAKGKEFELTGATVLRAEPMVPDYAETLPVHNALTGKQAVMPVVRLTVLAQLLDTSYQTIWRWTSDTKQLPEPVLTARLDRDRPVYHAQEVMVMVRAIGKHLNQFKYYRKDHVGTRDQIFNEIERLRETNYGETTNGNETQSRRQSPGSKARIRKTRSIG